VRLDDGFVYFGEYTMIFFSVPDEQLKWTKRDGLANRVLRALGTSFNFLEIAVT
jgi:hypothetical protein